jgi:hypothetical protein
VPDALDTVLENLAGFSPEYGRGLSNHGPMVAEVMTVLGRAERLPGWLEHYRPRLEPMPASRQTIGRGEWRQALGNFARAGDWADFFQRELAQVPWTQVLRDWVPRLAPGLSGAGGHGMIRTGHAIRALSREETPDRKRELGEALGYWAARYTKLPGILSARQGKLTPLEALSRIKWQYKRQRPPFRLISDGLKGLMGFSPFVGVINLVNLSDDLPERISQITGAMVRVFLAQKDDRHALIPYIHTVTVPNIARAFLPYLERREAGILTSYGWQLAGAVYTVFGQANPVQTFAPPSDDRQQLIDAALETNDSHVIKFTAACLGEYDLNSDDAYLAAAWEAVERLKPRPSPKPDG